jgi:hypothetical protein
VPGAHAESTPAPQSERGWAQWAPGHIPVHCSKMPLPLERKPAMHAQVDAPAALTAPVGHGVHAVSPAKL